MNCLNAINLPRKDLEAKWDKEGVFFKVLEHFKIIGAKYYIKINADQEIFNFEAFSTYGASNSIVWYTETWWK